MMLQTIRDRATGIVLWVIVGLICLTFALWGVSSYFQGGGKVNAATVNGEDISLQDFYSQVQQQRYRDEQMMGKRFDPANYDEEKAKKTVMDRMIREELEQQWVEEAGIRIGKDQIRQYLLNIPIFHDDQGRFSKEKYIQFLDSRAQSSAYFENVVIRQALALSQFRLGVRSSVLVTPEMVDQKISLEQQQRSFEYLVVNSQPLEKEVALNDAEILAVYEKNKSEYMSPEQVKLSYIELNEAVLLPQIKIDEAELTARYEQEKSKFVVPEQRKASHILLKTLPDTSESVKKLTRKKLETIAQNIAAGKQTFAEAAKENSEDQSSAEQGGDLGFFGKGMLVPEFEDVVFSMKIGEVSDLVETQYGYHLIQLNDIREATVQPFEKVKAQIENEMKMERVQTLFVDKKEQLENLAYENSKDLKPVAEKLGLKVIETDFYGRDAVSGLFKFKKVKEAAFSEEVFDARHNSNFIQTGSNEGVVIRIKEYKPTAQLSLDEVKDTIKNKLVKEKVKAIAQAKATELMKKIDEGATLDSLSELEEYELKKTGFIDRNNRKHPIALIKQGFALVPAMDKAVYAKVDLPAGDVALLKLLDVKSPDLSELAESERDRAQKSLSFIRSDAEYNAVLSTLEELGEVWINPDEL